MSAEPVTPITALPSEANRRRSPRFTVNGRITCEVAPHHIPVALLNMSKHGFFVRAPIKYEVGAIQRFRFTVATERDAIFVLGGQVIHCAAVVTNGTSAFLIGLDFVNHEHPVLQHAIDYLVRVLAH